MKKRILLPLLLAAALLGLFFFTRYGLPQFYTPEWARAMCSGAVHSSFSCRPYSADIVSPPARLQAMRPGSFSGNCSAASKRTFRPNICITVG